MTNRTSQYRMGSPFNWIVALVAIFLVFFIITRLVQFIWWLAFVTMPVLLIATFIIDRQVIFNFFKMIRGLYKRSVATGVIATILTAIGSPFVTLFLFGQAMFKRRLKKAEQQAFQEQQNKFGEYIEFEEVPNTRLINERRKTATRIRVEREERTERTENNTNRTQRQQNPPRDNQENNPYDKLWE